MSATDPWLHSSPVCQRPLCSVECVKCHVRITTYNLQTCLEEEEGCLQLGLLASELEGVSVGFYGLQELRWRGARECNIPVQARVRGAKGEGDWRLVWSWGGARHEHGVGLLMAPIWKDALLSYQ
jgi:endonuclease/exonuclease/phosphatase family metal-dependent hydrolase